MTEKNQYFTCKISFSKALIFLYFGQFDFKNTSTEYKNKLLYM